MYVNAIIFGTSTYVDVTCFVVLLLFIPSLYSFCYDAKLIFNAFSFWSDTRPNSILLSYGIAKQCTKQGEILEFLASGSSEGERCGLNLSILADLMGLEAIPAEISQQPFVPDYGFCFDDAESQPTLFYPSSKFYSEKPLLNLVGDLAHKSEIMVHLDGQIAFAGAQTEMKNILSIIAEFYLSNNSIKWRKQSSLVPQFDRYLWFFTCPKGKGRFMLLLV